MNLPLAYIGPSVGPAQDAASTVLGLMFLALVVLLPLSLWLGWSLSPKRRSTEEVAVTLGWLSLLALLAFGFALFVVLPLGLLAFFHPLVALLVVAGLVGTAAYAHFWTTTSRSYPG